MHFCTSKVFLKMSIDFKCIFDDVLFLAELPSHLTTTPLIKKQCKTADRVRSMCFNQRRSEIVVISSNGFIHCWDGLR